MFFIKKLTFFVLGSVIFAIIQNYLIIFAIVPLGGISFVLRKYYMKITVEIKRLDGMCNDS